jgi:IPT/TIG domain
VTATWNRNAEPDIATYILSYGTQSGSYTTSVDVGNVTSWQLNLSAGFRYYFVVQAKNTIGLISPRSVEVFADVFGPAPVIISLAPTSGSVGTPVTITGTNFGATPGTSTVRFNGTAATPTSWSTTSIGVPVPTGATTGPVVVTVGGTASNGPAFQVTAPSGLPAPWISQDIGGPALAGSATYAAGTFSVAGAGIDIWGTSDQFRFVYQSIDGDGEIVARVGSVQNTDPWAKAGIMIREDLTANAPNAMARVTAGNGMGFQRRVARGNLSTSIGGFSGVAPQWVRLVRSGNTISAYYSPTGTNWILMGSDSIPMPTRVYIGLVVTSHNPSMVNNATLTNVTVTGSASVLTMMQSADQVSTDSRGPRGQSRTATAGDGNLSQTQVPKRMVTDGLRFSDYDGDGKTDPAFYRPSTGQWGALQSSTGYVTNVVRQWGFSTDIPVPGDYDGDGKTDLAYYRPSSGTWSVLSSSSDSATSFEVVFGTYTEVPVPGDYDGDGRTDAAVYDPATGQWRILPSRTGVETVAWWGARGDVPVPGDYDGDGKTDPAVYRPSTGEWRIQQSSTNSTTHVTKRWGNDTDVPVPADYDGDGVTDIAIFRPATAEWTILRSKDGASTSLTGTTGTPIPGDYDGDGRADLVVFQSGVWQILQSTTNYTSGITVDWALATDVPLPTRP